jgi:transglutaminase-like putative cysteine protease
MLPCLLFAVVLAAPPADREFTFQYGATISGLPAGETVRLWIPLASSSSAQNVVVTKEELPAEAKIYKETEYGNQMYYLEPKADANGNIKLQLEYLVKRKGLVTQAAEGELNTRFFKADRLVPIDGKPLKLLEGQTVPAEEKQKARFLYDAVYNHMIYSKAGIGWGRGDSVWACDSKYGNCTDFHSLYISLVRSQKLAAKFEMGFGLPLEKGKGEIGGYHCWAFVHAAKEWIPVDISEARKLNISREEYYGKMPSNRVALTTGRDVTLYPKQAGEPLNYFVYPYVEVKGQAHPAEKIKPILSFADR